MRMEKTAELTRMKVCSECHKAKEVGGTVFRGVLPNKWASRGIWTMHEDKYKNEDKNGGRMTK